MKDRLSVVVRDAKHLAFFIISVVVLAAVVFFHLSVRNEIIQLGYELNKENLRGRQLVRQRSELELEKAIMKNPEEIGKLAQERFGMAIPSKEQLIRIHKGKGK
jgi:cell division protein FtsL